VCNLETPKPRNPTERQFLPSALHYSPSLSFRPRKGKILFNRLICTNGVEIALGVLALSSSMRVHDKGKPSC
jgi:hypothetical protein